MFHEVVVHDGASDQLPGPLGFLVAGEGFSGEVLQGLQRLRLGGDPHTSGRLPGLLGGGGGGGGGGGRGVLQVEDGLVLVQLGAEGHVVHLQLSDPGVLLGQQSLELRNVGAHRGF